MVGWRLKNVLLAWLLLRSYKVGWPAATWLSMIIGSQGKGYCNHFYMVILLAKSDISYLLWSGGQELELALVAKGEVAYTNRVRCIGGHADTDGDGLAGGVGASRQVTVAACGGPGVGGCWGGTDV